MSYFIGLASSFIGFFILLCLAFSCTGKFNKIYYGDIDSKSFAVNCRAYGGIPIQYVDGGLLCKGASPREI